MSWSIIFSVRTFEPTPFLPELDSIHIDANPDDDSDVHETHAQPVSSIAARLEVTFNVLSELPFPGIYTAARSLYDELQQVEGMDTCEVFEKRLMRLLSTLWLISGAEPLGMILFGRIAALEKDVKALFEAPNEAVSLEERLGKLDKSIQMLQIAVCTCTPLTLSGLNRMWRRVLVLQRNCTDPTVGLLKDSLNEIMVNPTAETMKKFKEDVAIKGVEFYSGCVNDLWKPFEGTCGYPNFI